MNDPISKNDLRFNHHSISKHQLPLNTAPSSLMAGLQSFAPESPRRTTHGGCAWSLPSRDGLTLRQPQDGSPTNVGQSVASGMLNALRARSANVAAADNDDKLSGATRSLSSRVLGLNGMKPKPATKVGVGVGADTERYFEEPSSLLGNEPFRRVPLRKQPSGSRRFPRVPTPQSGVA